MTAKDRSRRSLDGDSRRSLDGERVQRAEDGEKKDPSIATARIYPGRAGSQAERRRRDVHVTNAHARPRVRPRLRQRQAARRRRNSAA